MSPIAMFDGDQESEEDYSFCPILGEDPLAEVDMKHFSEYIYVLM